MYTLCSEVRNVVFDIKSLKKFYSNIEFNELINTINRRYNVYILGLCPEFEIYNKSIVVNSYFSFENQADIQKFLEESGIEHYNTIVITAIPETIKQVTRNNLSSVGLIAEKEDYRSFDIRYMPDQIWTTSQMKDILLHNGFDISYFESIGLNSPSPMKFVNFHVFTDQLTYAFDSNINVDLIYAGRYFRFNDPRAYAHRLTQLLLHLKKNKPYAISAIGNSMNYILDILNQEGLDFDIITVVPSRPNTVNRLGNVLNSNLKREYLSKRKLNLLYTKKNYESQKKITTFAEKANNVKDVFGYKEKIKGHVLLIDDIFTSGATALECARMLYEAGASKVTILPFAITQSSTAEIRLPLIKEENEAYKLLFRTSDSQPFWSTGFQGSIKDYETGRNEYLRGNNVDNYFGE